jgi:serine protease Do
MNEALDQDAGAPASTAEQPTSGALERIARQQRLVIVSMLVATLFLGVLIGAVVTRGAFADPDNRIVISSTGPVADNLSASFANAASIVEPAVVHIDVQEGEGRNAGREAKGSGVLVTASGYILTNFHVVEGAKKMRVRLYDHREFDAELIGSDRDTDLAVIRILTDKPLPFARFGDSNRLRVGDWVLAIGSPFGLEQTVTAGIISAKGRETEGGSSAFQQFLQTDAAINPGNSGGPLVNLSGEVVGINTQIATRTGAFSGIGFALPSSTASEIYNELVAKGRVNRGFLGVEVADLSADVAKINGLDGTDGVVIGVLRGDSPAAAAGLASGDIITEINGERVRNRRDLIRRIGSFPAGSLVKLTYVREGNPGTATAKLGDREEMIAAAGGRSEDFDGEDPDGEQDEGLELPPGHPDIDPPVRPSLGITLRTLTPDLARDRSLDGLTGAYVMSVDPGSLAAERGLQAGDVVISVNQRRIQGQPEFSDRLSALRSGDELILQVARRVGAKIERRFISLQMP